VGGVPGHDSPQVMFAEDQDAVGEFGKDAVEILHRARAGRAEREQELLARGYPAYTTTPGWLGYDDVGHRDRAAPRRFPDVEAPSGRSGVV
jgi:hypothetical protein